MKPLPSTDLYRSLYAGFMARFPDFRPVGNLPFDEWFKLFSVLQRQVNPGLMMGIAMNGSFHGFHRRNMTIMRLLSSPEFISRYQSARARGMSPQASAAIASLGHKNIESNSFHEHRADMQAYLRNVFSIVSLEKAYGKLPEDSGREVDRTLMRVIERHTGTNMTEQLASSRPRATG